MMPSPSPSPTGSTQTAQVISLLRWLLIAVFVVVGWMTLSYMAKVLAPILAALGIAYMLNPVLERLVKAGMSRPLGAGILLVLFVGLIVIALVTAVSAIVHQVSDVAHDLPRMMNNLDGWLERHFDVEVPDDWQSYLTKENLEKTLGGGPVRAMATAALGGVLAFVAHAAEFLLVPVFAFYFLVDWPNMLRRIDNLVPPRRRRGIREMVLQIDGVVAGWVRGQAIVTAILATLYAIGFTIVGMPLSVPIGIVVGILTVIPFVGTLVGAVIAAAVTIAGGGSLSTLGEVGAVILVLHLLEAGFLTPKIVGHRVGLSESGALFAVVAGGKLLGFVGVVLAVPIAATVAVLIRYAVRYYEHTEFFGRETDADVVITPAMALIMPGVKLEPVSQIPDDELKPMGADK
ncbi:MAG TPA: AI-2E family transporter [Kofleriaceae bacterium]|jgi:predicted PurR-regulated permease PerM|nr:AI-2E family transporter [Kofleriaceae bacterium]